MGKVKEFLKKHKWQIAGAAIAAAGGTALYFIGRSDGAKMTSEKLANGIALSNKYVLMEKEAFENAVKNAEWYGTSCLITWMKKFVPEADRLCQEFADSHPGEEFVIEFKGIAIDSATGALREK